MKFFLLPQLSIPFTAHVHKFLGRVGLQPVSKQHMPLLISVYNPNITPKAKNSVKLGVILATELLLPSRKRKNPKQFLMEYAGMMIAVCTTHWWCPSAHTYT